MRRATLASSRRECEDVNSYCGFFFICLRLIEHFRCSIWPRDMQTCKLHEDQKTLDLIGGLPCLHIENAITLRRVHGRDGRDLQCLACHEIFRFLYIDEYGNRQYQPPLLFATECARIYVSCFEATFELESRQELFDAIVQESRRLSSLLSVFAGAGHRQKSAACRTAQNCSCIKSQLRVDRDVRKVRSVLRHSVKIARTMRLDMQQIRAKFIENANKIASVAQQYSCQVAGMLQTRPNLGIRTGAAGSCVYCEATTNKQEERLVCVRCSSVICGTCFLQCVEHSKQATFRIVSKATEFEGISNRRAEKSYLTAL